LEYGFLSQEGTKTTLPSILSEIFAELTKNGKCTIQINVANTIHLKCSVATSSESYSVLDHQVHMSICNKDALTSSEWDITTQQNNYTALSDLSGKNSLSKELLHDIGFDPLSLTADLIMERASSLAKHIDPCDWAEIFIQDEFRCNPFLNSDDNQLARSEFPFQSTKIHEWFQVSLSKRNVTEGNPESYVNIVNVQGWISASEIPCHSIEEQFENLYHGTDHDSAVDILNGRGIHLPAGRQKRDFSSGKGFYLTKSFEDAYKWAKRKSVKPAVLVFRPKHDEFWNNEKIQRLTLLSNENPEEWKEIVALFRSGKQSTKKREILRDYDLIEGSVAKVSHVSGHLEYKAIPLSYQPGLGLYEWLFE
ncbi:Nitrogen permease regulator 2-like protein, partial [Stylophora pistillata]